MNEKQARLYTVHRYYEQADKAALLRQAGARIRAVVTGGHTGISNAVMAQLPALEAVSPNGVGTDAIDLAYARGRGIHVTATFGALTEDVADLAIGLLIATGPRLCTSDRFVRSSAWPPAANLLAPLPLARKGSGMRVVIVGLGRVGRAVAAQEESQQVPLRAPSWRRNVK